LGTPGEGESNPHVPAAGIPASGWQCESRHPQGCRSSQHGGFLQLLTIPLKFSKGQVVVNRGATERHPFGTRFSALTRDPPLSKELPVKIAATIARYLLGVMFLIFGSNMLFHFIPNPPMPPGPMANFSTAMVESHYNIVVGLCQVIPAILLLINRYVPLALTVLAAEIVNIITFHITMQMAGLPMALVVAILWLLVFVRVKSSFAGIFEPTPQR
jgi:putative oxidoreductase